ncbi:MAG: fibronectin type III domain-containing protein, partial [Bacteroidota bacterium]
QMLRGNFAFGTLLANAGFPSVPSLQTPSPGANPYFDGGFNTANYTCHAAGNPVNGVQIECNSNVRSSYASRKVFADSLASVLFKYFLIHENLNLSGCVTPTPIISANGPTTFCPGNSVTLTSTASNSYLWNTGATTQSILVLTAGIYSVTVSNAPACYASSAPFTITVSSCATPTNISSTVISGASATINWTGNSCAYQYRLQYRKQGTTTWTETITTAPTVFKTLTGLTANSTYEYQIRTDCNSAGTSFSSYTAIQTFTTICTCSKPTNIAKGNISQTSVTVNWTGNSCAYQYRLQYRKQGINSWTTKTILAPTTTKILTGLTANSVYEYRMRTDCNSSGSANSGFTSTVTFTTLLRLEDTENIFESSMTVTPNPCHTCEIIGTENSSDLIITDILGRKLNATFSKSSNGFYINIPECNKGILFIRNIKTGEVLKFVKE